MQYGNEKPDKPSWPDIQLVDRKPDGNRRFAKRLMKQPWKGHEWGAEKLKQIVKWSKEVGIKVLTIYTLSLENLKSRPKKELNFLLNLARKEIKDILASKDNYIFKNKIRVRFIGRLQELPADLVRIMKETMKRTSRHKDFILNLAVAYGGRQEILDACRKIVSDGLRPEQINEDMFKHYLWTDGYSDPDLIIRTGGEKRTSNFLIFQSAYSELAFVDKLWPEFSKEDFLAVIADFSERERRFGK